MSELLIMTSQSVPEDSNLCSLDATITDKGVVIQAISPIFGEYAEKLCAKRRTIKGGDYVVAFDHLTFYSFPNPLALELGTGGPSPDLFVPTGGIDEYGNRRKPEPNLIWLAALGLKDGVTITFTQPAHVPADIMEYLNRSMERLRMFYIKYIRKTTYKATLIERG